MNAAQVELLQFGTPTVGAPLLYYERVTKTYTGVATLGITTLTVNFSEPNWYWYAMFGIDDNYSSPRKEFKKRPWPNGPNTLYLLDEGNPAPRINFLSEIHSDSVDIHLNFYDLTFNPTRTLTHSYVAYIDCYFYGSNLLNA